MKRTVPARYLARLLLVVVAVWLLRKSADLTPAYSLSQPPHVEQNVSDDMVRRRSVAPTVVDLQSFTIYSTNNDVSNTVQFPFPPNNGTLNLHSSFKAIDYTQSQQGVPPNPAIMAGSDHVVVSVQSSFQVFDKNGNGLTSLIQFEDFWGSSCGTGSSTMIYFYPFSNYDEAAGRYILGIAGFDGAINTGRNGYFCVAVSQTDSATGLWYLYNFDGNPGPGSDYRVDFPRAAVGQQAIYIAATLYDDFDFVQNQLYAFDKSDMYSGISADSLAIVVDDSYFNLVPADLKGFNSGGWPADPTEPHYFVEAEFGAGDLLRLFSLSDPWGTPSVNLAGTLPVTAYSLTQEQPQAGTSTRLIAFDTRLVDAEYWNGRLWTTHAVGCNPGGGTVNCLRWYEIDLTSSPSPTLIQEGTFRSPGDYRSFPNLAVNACGDMLMGYTKTNDDIFPGAYVAGRESQDTPGQLKSETELHAGEVLYIAFDGHPFDWGRYTATTIDPDGKSFWHLGEYSRLQPDARWSTWVGSFSWSGCGDAATPTPTASLTPTATGTATPTATFTPSPTPTRTSTPTVSASPTASVTPTSTSSATLTATDTATPAPTPTTTPTATPTATPTVTATPTMVEANQFKSWIPVILN